MESTQMVGNWSSSLEVVLNQSFPVHRACRDGDVDHLSSLLAAGTADLYEEDDFYGWTPMHWAAYFGKLQCMIRLKEGGVFCDAPTERLNQTPTHIAAYGGHSHCLQWLLNSGAMINKQLNCLKKLINTQSVGGNCDVASSKFSQTPVHLCAYAGHPQCLYWLLRCNTNTDLQDYMGETAVHKAARTGSMECVSLLVSQGAKLSISNYSGSTASQVAAGAGFTECAAYLERATQLQATPTPCIKSPPTLPTHSGIRESPEGQPADTCCLTQTHFISTDTYHSTPHISNGTAHIAHPPLHMNNNNTCPSDCDMEMEDEDCGAPHGDASAGATTRRVHNGAPPTFNGFGGMGDHAVANGDVLLHEGVQRNFVPLAGKKRCREDADAQCFKRARNEDSHAEAEKCKLTGWFLNNSHVSGHVTRIQESDSMVEHMTTVSLQQGYDSMILEAMAPLY